MNKAKKRSVLLPVVLIVLSVCLILGTTLAYFTDTRSTNTPVNFGKIEISVNEPFETTIPLKDALPGDKIVDKISFTKATDSEDMYIRVKALYETTSTVPGVRNLVSELNTYSLDLASGVGYAWDTSYVNHYYLVTASNANALYNVIDSTEIVFTNAVSVPRQLRQLDTYAQYMEGITLKIEIQAIQSKGVSSTLAEANETFSEVLGETEILPTNPSYFTFSGSTVTGLTEEGKALNKIIVPASYSIVGASQPSNTFGPSNAHSTETYTYGNDIKVINIGDGAFNGCTNLENVIIPKGITSIGSNVFNQCYSLSNVTLPSSITNIANYAFYKCSSLTSINIPEGVVSITEYAFYECSNLRSVDIPSSVKSISRYAFYNCSNLRTVNMKEGITSIGESAFKGCGVLTDLIIPESVISIGYYAFMECWNIKNLTIPGSISSIGYCVFDSCTGLTSLTIQEGVTSIGMAAFSRCPSLTDLIIPSSVTSIAFDAFANCPSVRKIDGNLIYLSTMGNEYFALNDTVGTSVESVSISQNCKIIMDSAFENCTNLTSIDIPEGVTIIGGNAFSWCNNLSSVTIPSSVTTLGSGVFTGCSSLTSISIPNTVKSLSGNAFSGCTGLQKIDGGLIYISTIDNEYFALYDTVDTSIESVTINDNCKFILNDAFRDCYSLTSVRIPNGVKSIGDNAFYNCHYLSSIDIPGGVISIGDNAFYYCLFLTSVTIPSSVTSIGIEVFSRCHSLTSLSVDSDNAVFDSRDNCNAIIETSTNTLVLGCSVTTIPESVTSIGEGAFNYCRLSNLTIPEGVINIGSSAFSWSNLTSIFIPSSVKNIDVKAFENCGSLTSLVIDPANTVFDSRDNCNAIIETKSNTLIIGLKYSTIPEGVVSIGEKAFYGQDLESVTIPASVTSIRSDAFHNCDRLTSLTISSSVKNLNIGSSAFYGCENLSSLIIPEGVSSIGDLAFVSCSSLTSITIPSSVTHIGSLAFGRKLTSIVVDSANLVYDSRDNCNAIIETSTNTLVLGCRNSIVPEGVVIIGRAAFMESNLTSITISSSVTTIANQAFSYCNVLASVYYLGTNSDWSSISISENNTELTNASRYYVYIDDSNELVVARDNAGQEEPVNTSTYTSEIDTSDPSKIVATVTFLNGDGDEDDYRVEVVKSLS